jgi:hypothetical protein
LNLTGIGSDLKSLKVLGGKLEIPNYRIACSCNVCQFKKNPSDSVCLQPLKPKEDSKLKEIFFSNVNIDESSFNRLMNKHCGQVTKLTMHESLPQSSFRDEFFVNRVAENYRGQSLCYDFQSIPKLKSITLSTTQNVYDDWQWSLQRCL